ncbi:MAG: potassium transporter TrkG [Phycisphaerales bacterium]|jgi:trk system potassium uptake protein TrkH|nr:potassium transporter TrkG [Phycisphaerales bacterium]
MRSIGLGGVLAARRVVTRALMRVPSPRLAMLGYLSYMAVGWVLLALPVSHQGGQSVRGLDALFTSASALSTTGLGVVSTSGAFNLFGEMVILMLIQAGGIGYMTLGSFVVLSSGKTLSDARRGVGELSFSLPEGFRIEPFIRSVVMYTFVCELVGALALWAMFADAGTPRPLWDAIFHSVSAFCTAGFSTFDDSLVAFRGHFGVNLVIDALSLAGAVGFIVAVDLGRRVAGRTASMTLTSRIIVGVTMWMIAGGTVVLALVDPEIRALPGKEQFLAALFQSTSACTTVGFNSVPVGAIGSASTLVIVVLMLIGASPSGTGGGIKTTSVTALFGVVRSTLRGTERVTFFGREIPRYRIRQAMSAVVIYVSVLIVGLFALMLTDARIGFEDLTFEAFSAIGTVGLSRGITGELSDLGKLVVIGLMFVGRVGPLTLGLAFLSPRIRPTDADLAI